MFSFAWFKELLAEPATEAGRGGVFKPPSARLTDAPVLLAFATQTGAAETFAKRTCTRLRDAGVEVRMVDFYDLDPALLETTSQALFVVSTTCDGDPPDMAEAFQEEFMGRHASLAHLRYGMLALGDRAYDDFCAFGHRFDAWLKAGGAQAWFDLVEVDDEDDRAVAHWLECVDALTASPAPCMP